MTVCFYYCKHGSTATLRTVTPKRIWFGTSDWHDEEGEQWFLDGFDVDRQAMRTFPMRNISGWRPTSVGVTTARGSGGRE